MMELQAERARKLIQNQKKHLQNIAIQFLKAQQEKSNKSRIRKHFMRQGKNSNQTSIT
jgi:hypothetical protein